MKVIVLVSGGMDSVVALYDAAKGHQVVGAVSFDYGSKHNHKEIPFARHHTEKLGVSHQVISLGFVNELFASDLLQSGGEVPEGHYEESNMKTTVVPFRNGIMLSIAAGFAESKGAEGLVIAAHSGDHAIYPDCRKEFMKPMEDAIRNGTYAGISLLRPFIGMRKEDIAARGHELGVDFSQTWSCYKGGDIHCGKCGTCVERREAFLIAEIPDPTEYVDTEDLPKAPERERTQVPSSDATAAILAELDTIDFEISEEDYKRVKETLDSVEGLTQYEDQKASRILAATGIFTAVAGVLYGNIVRSADRLENHWVDEAFHGAFYAFVFFFTISGAILIKSIYPWFNIPETWKGSAPLNSEKSENQFEHLARFLRRLFGLEHGKNKSIKSRLFGFKIGETDPHEWASYFSEKKNSLTKDYYKDCVHESFLISQKIIKKIQAVRKGLVFLALGVSTFLIFWLPTAIWYQIANDRANRHEPSRIMASNGIQYSFLLLSDADNTLWDTNKVYADAQVSLYNSIREKLDFPDVSDPLAMIRKFDQEIAEKHADGLKYPADLLVRAVEKDVNQRGLVNASLTEQEIAEMSNDYSHGISQIPMLRRGVHDGLEELKRIGARVIICTEGKESHVLERLSHYELLGYVDGVEFVQKNRDSYLALAKKYNPEKLPQFVVGDQLDRDISMAADAGFRTILYLGGFKPNWLPSTGTIVPDEKVDSYRKVPEVILNLQAEEMR